MHRWEQNVDDHKTYDESFANCAKWIKEQALSLRAFSSLEGDLEELHSRLSRITVTYCYIYLHLFINLMLHIPTFVY